MADRRLENREKKWMGVNVGEESEGRSDRLLADANPPRHRRDKNPAQGARHKTPPTTATPNYIKKQKKTGLNRSRNRKKETQKKVGFAFGGQRRGPRRGIPPIRRMENPNFSAVIFHLPPASEFVLLRRSEETTFYSDTTSTPTAVGSGTRRDPLRSAASAHPARCCLKKFGPARLAAP